jgi:hypothetical protein
VCAALAFYAGGRSFALGCPPTPAPVEEPRPCALAREGEPIPLGWDSQGRLTRADDLQLTYRADGRLERMERPFLRGTLETSAISASADVVEQRVRIRTPSFSPEDGEVVEDVRDAHWRFSLEHGVVTRLEMTQIRSDGPVLVSDRRFRRSPGRIESSDAITGERTVSEIDRHGRILSFTATLAEMDDDAEHLSFEWDGARWTHFVDSTARIPIDYRCAE